MLVRNDAMEIKEAFFIKIYNDRFKCMRLYNGCAVLVFKLFDQILYFSV